MSVYSQGEFTFDEDSTDYLVQVGLFALVALLLPLMLVATVFLPKFETQRRWMLGIILLGAIATMAWATAISGMGQPVKSVNDQMDVVKAWSNNAVNTAETINSNLQSLIDQASLVVLNECSLVMPDTSSVTQNANNIVAEITRIGDEVNEISIDTGIEEMSSIGLSMTFGLAILLPILVCFVIWTFSLPGKSISIGVLIFSTVILCLLNVVLLPTLVAFSDFCTSTDTVVKRLSDNDEAVVFYIDCMQGSEVYPALNTYLEETLTEIDSFKNNIEQWATFYSCPQVNDFVPQLDEISKSITDTFEPLVQCSTVNPLYQQTKDVVCGTDVYDIVMYLHQSLFATYFIVLAFFFGVLITKDQYSIVENMQIN